MNSKKKINIFSPCWKLCLYFLIGIPEDEIFGSVLLVKDTFNKISSSIFL